MALGERLHAYIAETSHSLLFPEENGMPTPYLPHQLAPQAGESRQYSCAQQRQAARLWGRSGQEANCCVIAIHVEADQLAEVVDAINDRGPYTVRVVKRLPCGSVVGKPMLYAPRIRVDADDQPVVVNAKRRGVHRSGIVERR